MNRYIPAKETNIRILGRTVVQEPLPLFWTASGIEFITDGSETALELEADHSAYEQWIRVELDGATLIRMPLNKGMNRISVFRGCEKGKPRHVRLFKEVQAMGNDPQALLLVHAVETDGELLPLPDYSCRLEFIGDSITSGEGLAGAHGFNDWVSCMFSTAGEYGLETGKALNADVRVISQSGWGMFCGWDNCPTSALLLVYEKVCGPLTGERNAAFGAAQMHDFASWQPDAIVVNLGTNDEGSFRSPAFVDADGVEHKQTRGEDGRYSAASSANIRDAVQGFLRMLRRNNPGAYILLTFGIYPSDVPGEMIALLREEQARYTADTGDDRCSVLEYPPIRDDWFGSRGHPGIPSHRSAAETLIPVLKDILMK